MDRRKHAGLARVKEAFLYDWQFRAGVAGVVILLALVVAAPLLASHDPYEFGVDNLAPPGTAGNLFGE